MSDLGKIQNQASNILPPRTNSIIAISVDATSRSYDLWTPSILGRAYRSDLYRDVMFVTLLADGNDVYVSFSDTSKTINPTTVVTAGTTLTASGNGSSFSGADADAYCWKLVNNADQPFALQRGLDRFMNIRTASGTATLRFCISSQESQ